MKIGRLFFGIRKYGTHKFRWFYCPLGKGISREKFVFFWWIGRKWYIALPKRKGGEQE